MKISAGRPDRWDMAASVQESRPRSSLDAWLVLSPAEFEDSIERIVGEKSDRLMEGAFGEFRRLANKFHGHADTSAAPEIGTEGDVLFRGYAEAVIKQSDGAGRADGGYNRGNGGPGRLSDNIADSAADLPGLALGPRSLVIDSAMEQAFEVLKGFERRVNRNRYGNGVFDARQHAKTPQVGGLCADSQGKTRANVPLLKVEQLALDVEPATIAAQ